MLSSERAGALLASRDIQVGVPVLSTDCPRRGWAYITAMPVMRRAGASAPGGVAVLPVGKALTPGTVVLL